jgi:hypothetical protein
MCAIINDLMHAGSMNWIGRVLLVSLALFAAGCETAPLTTQQNPNADFSRYRTFNLLPVETPVSAQDPDRVQRLVRAAQGAAVSALLAKGFTQGPSNESDLSVGLLGQAVPWARDGAEPTVSSVRTARGRVAVAEPDSPDSILYDEKSLRVEIFDNRTHERVWAGWTSKVTSRQAQTNDVQKAVQRILSRFPSRSAPAKEP